MILESRLRLSRIGLFNKATLEFRHLLDGVELYLTDNQDVVEFFLQGTDFCELLKNEEQEKPDSAANQREKMKYLDESSSEEADTDPAEVQTRPLRSPIAGKPPAASHQDKPEDIYTQWGAEEGPSRRRRTPFDDD